MFKRIILFALILLPSVGVFSQEASKIVYIDADEVFVAMPETQAMKAELDKLGTMFDSELKTMNADFTKKYTLYLQQQDSLVESIKLRRQEDLQEMQQRITTETERAREELGKKQQELAAPIQKKLLDTIKLVSDENNFTYVLYKNSFLYIAPHATDITPLVKKKLGLPDAPPAPKAPQSKTTPAPSQTTPAKK